MNLAPGRGQSASGHRVSFGQDHDAGANGQHVAAEGPEFLLGHIDHPDPEVTEQLPEPHRKEWRKDNREIVGDRQTLEMAVREAP